MPNVTMSEFDALQSAFLLFCLLMLVLVSLNFVKPRGERRSGLRRMLTGASGRRLWGA